MNKEQILSDWKDVIAPFLEETYGACSNWFYEEPSDLRVDVDGVIVLIDTEDTEGGYEGAGESCHIVFSLKYGDEVVYVKIDGSYYSYGGIHADYDDAKIVEKQEKTIFVYE